MIYNIKEQIVTAPLSTLGRATIILKPEQLNEHTTHQKNKQRI
jgi:hypothetical protein